MREALTDQDDDEQPPQSVPAVTITQGWPDSAPRVATDQATDTLAPKSESDVVLAKLKEAGLPFIDSTDPVGTVTLGDGTRLTLRELNGLDEVHVERMLDHYDLKPDGAGQSAGLRFLSLMSISHIDGKEQVEVRHVQQIENLLLYKRADLARIVAAYIRFNLTVDGSPFRSQG